MSDKKHKILIVEDERPVSKVLSLKLSSNGFEVDTALNGKEALDLLKKETYSLVLLDLIMPEMDGFEVLREIKKTKNKHTTVIVTSNLGQEEDQKKAKELGAKDYIIKSETTLIEIAKKINSLLNKK